LLLDPAPAREVIAPLNDHDLAKSYLWEVARMVGRADTLAASTLVASGAEPSEQGVDGDADRDVFATGRAMGILPEGMDPLDFQRRVAVYAESARALAAFEPDPDKHTFDGKATVVGARQGNGEETAFWLRFLPRGSLELVEATHHTILFHLRELLG
jgi:hypothetical protein